MRRESSSAKAGGLLVGGVSVGGFPDRGLGVGGEGGLFPQLLWQQVPQ